MYKERNERCQNARAGYPILAPACLRREAEVKLHIIYNEVEDDKLKLCPECADNIQQDAKRHGYRVKRSHLH